MKATLTFNLPEETEEHQTALNGGTYRSALWNISQVLRSERKYGEPSQEVLDLIKKIEDLLPAGL